MPKKELVAQRAGINQFKTWKSHFATFHLRLNIVKHCSIKMIPSLVFISASTPFYIFILFFFSFQMAEISLSGQF